VRFVFCVSVGLCCVFLWVVLGDEGDGVPVAFCVMFRVDLVLYHPVVCGSGVVCLLFVCAFHFGVCTVFHVLCVC
jgi:hypothetical protein